MMRAALRGAVVALAMLCGVGCGAEPSKSPAAAGATAATPAPARADSSPQGSPPSLAAGSQGSPAPGPTDGDDPPGTCGSEVCALDQFCEDLYKGHALDARGRPLQRQKCMPIPESCKALPTCACVTKHVAATHCKEDVGRVYVNDYPDRR